jgi:hypothetical protein
MTRWEPLPDTMTADARRLAVQLRRMKDRSGLTVPALAARSGQSTESWAQYLNGLKVPPRDAVEVLGQLSGADYERLGALWELARAGGGSGTPVPDPLDPLAPEEGLPAAAPAGRPGRGGPLVVAVGLLAAAAAVALIVVLGSTAAAPERVAGPGDGTSRSASGPAGVPGLPGASAGTVNPGAVAGAGGAVGGAVEPEVMASGAATAGERGAGTGAATAPSGTAGTTTGGTSPTATTAPTTAPAPTTSTVPSSPSPGPSASKGGRLCLGLIILGVCIGA